MRKTSALLAGTILLSLGGTPLRAQKAAEPVIALPLPPELAADFSPARSAPPPAPTAPQAVLLQPGAAELKAALVDWVKAAPAQRREREAIAAFYAGRDQAPLWLADGRWTAAAQAVLARLETAGDDGLDLRATPSPQGASTAGELALSEAAVAYGRQASGGRVDPQRISILITVKPEMAEPARILADLSAAGGDAGEVLQAFNPPHRGYQVLRRKLGELRRATQPRGGEAIAAGPILRIGMRDARVPLLRARFGLDSAGPDDAYDPRIAAEIADFQRANGLPASGILTSRTVAALAGGETSRLENEIVANMERWRWLPRDLGAKHIEVNIPDFTVKVMDGGKLLHQARVVVGKPDTPTPIFSNTMQFLIVNPYWSVPQSIIKKEKLPRLALDPDYLRRLGYEVVHRGNAIFVRQPPGERNALGRIKFMFPNDHAVYLHDTPSRALFASDKRAYSHGCVRVDQPFKLAEILLGPAWNETKLQSLIGGPERTVRLPQPLPIHIEYFTASVDESGRLLLRDDIYGYSKRLKLALGLER